MDGDSHAFDIEVTEIEEEMFQTDRLSHAISKTTGVPTSVPTEVPKLLRQLLEVLGWCCLC